MRYGSNKRFGDILLRICRAPNCNVEDIMERATKERDEYSPAGLKNECCDEQFKNLSPEAAKTSKKDRKYSPGG